MLCTIRKVFERANHYSWLVLSFLYYHHLWLVINGKKTFNKNTNLVSKYQNVPKRMTVTSMFLYIIWRFSDTNLSFYMTLDLWHFLSTFINLLFIQLFPNVLPCSRSVICRYTHSQQYPRCIQCWTRIDNQGPVKQ